ncbi:hypothetical protein ACLESD_39050 [Pyxidicoccus sp. 3LFB2]
MQWMQKVGVLVTGLVAGGLTACSPLRLGVPESLERQSQPLPIQQDKGSRQEGTLKVAEFSARYDLDSVDWTRGGSLGSGLTACGANAAYRFTLASTARETPVKVECEEQMSGKSAMGLSTSQNRVNCRLEGGGRLDLTQTRRMEGKATHAPIVQGQAQVGAVNLRVESTNEQQKGLPVPYLGFHLLRGEQPVASLQVLEPMQLWMAPELSAEEREAVVLTAFSLMLQRAWTSDGPLDCHG